jgi:hypothetical protein
MDASEEQKPVDLVTVPLISAATICICMPLIFWMTLGVQFPFLTALPNTLSTVLGLNSQVRNIPSLLTFFLLAILSVSVPFSFVWLLLKRMPEDLIRGNVDAVCRYSLSCFVFILGIFIWSACLGELRTPGGDLRTSLYAYGFEADPDGQLAFSYSWLLYFVGYGVIGALVIFIDRLGFLLASTITLAVLYWIGLSSFVNEASKLSKFNQELWQSTDPRSSNKRVAMLVTVTRELEDKDKEQVLAMLGRPDKTETTRWYREHWFYNLGNLNTSKGAHPLYLCIEMYGNKVVAIQRNSTEEWMVIHGHP